MKYEEMARRMVQAVGAFKPGDIVFLKVHTVLNDERMKALRQYSNGVEERTGLKIVVLDKLIDVVQVGLSADQVTQVVKQTITQLRFEEGKAEEEARDATHDIDGVDGEHQDRELHDSSVEVPEDGGAARRDGAGSQDLSAGDEPEDAADGGAGEGDPGIREGGGGGSADE